MLEELKDSFSELSDHVGIYAQLSHEVPLKKSPHGFHIMSFSYVLMPGLSPIRMKANELSSQSYRPCGFSRHTI